MGNKKSRAPVQWEQVPKGGVQQSSQSKGIDVACDRNWDEAWGAEVDGLVDPPKVFVRCLSVLVMSSSAASRQLGSLAVV